MSSKTFIYKGEEYAMPGVLVKPRDTPPFNHDDCVHPGFNEAYDSADGFFDTSFFDENGCPKHAAGAIMCNFCVYNQYAAEVLKALLRSRRLQEIKEKGGDHERATSS